jgi:hypothetical protein
MKKFVKYLFGRKPLKRKECIVDGIALVVWR